MKSIRVVFDIFDISLEDAEKWSEAIIDSNRHGNYGMIVSDVKEVKVPIQAHGQVKMKTG